MFLVIVISGLGILQHQVAIQN